MIMNFKIGSQETPDGEFYGVLVVKGEEPMLTPEVYPTSKKATEAALEILKKSILSATNSIGKEIKVEYLEMPIEGRNESEN